MLTAVSTPELRTIVEGLAEEYGLGLAMYFGERSASLWDVAPESKLSSLLQIVDQVRPGRPNLLVMHLGLDGPEMAALIDRIGLDSMTRPEGAPGYSMEVDED